MSEQDKHSKTEEPTSKKVSEARSKGNIPRSRDLASTVTLLTAFITLYITGGYMVAVLKRTFSDYLGGIGTFQISEANAYALFLKTLAIISIVLLPFLLVMIIVGIVANFTQGGVVLSTEKLQVDLNKLNPIKGMSKLFQKEALFEGAKSLVKIVIVGYIGYKVLRDEVGTFIYLTEKDVSGIIEYVSHISFKVVLHTSGVMLILGVLDLMFVKWRFMENLRMTKQEVKDESKDAEGDPQIKGKIRSMRLAQHRRRLRKIIPTADVVITNPTHYAVALKYDRISMGAPVVLAKGVDYLALRIREIAQEHKIMLVENRFLARELYAQVKEGEEIPESLYAAVAEVLAYVYSIKGKI